MMQESNNKSEDDEIEALYVLWKENFREFDERKLRQYSETLFNDISKFIFDVSSESDKFMRYGKEFIEIMKFKSDDAIKHVDLYWIHEQLASKYINEREYCERNAYNLILEQSTKSADHENAINIDFSTNIIMQEFLASCYLMRNLNTIDGLILHNVLSDFKYKNIRTFFDAGLKHECITIDDDEITKFFEESDVTMILHLCIKENLIFLIDFFTTRYLHAVSNKVLKKIIALKDVDGNNIFHLACEKRIKFLIEDLWILIQKAFNEDPKEIEKLLLNQNNNGLNVFQLAFKMPLEYSNYDFANEIKTKSTLMNYYRDPGPLELEMYNFESALNMIFDIARRHVNNKYKKSLIFGKNLQISNPYDNYSYGKAFQEFRCDFLQLRFHCITKLSSIKTNNIDMCSKVYNFLCHYVGYFMHSHCNEEEEMMNLFQKLSFDGFLSDFFKIFIINYFSYALLKFKKFENVEKLIEITKKTLTQKELLQVMIKSRLSGNNILQMVIDSNSFELFEIIWSSFEFSSKDMIDLILSKNNEGYNSLYMMIQNHQSRMLQSMLEYFSLHLAEVEIINVLNAKQKRNYKIMDTAVLHYDQQIFNLLTDFVKNHLSIDRQKTLMSLNIILLAVSKWKENALISTLTMIESLFDENEIKDFIFATHWEGQTAFHIASKNSNLSQLQKICKFARYYLTESDFIEIISAKDANEYAIITDEASHTDILNNLPILSNFYTNYSAYVWVPMYDIENGIPTNGVQIGKDEDENEIYLARRYSNNDEFELFGLSKKTKIDNIEEQQIEVLNGIGLEWMENENNHSKALKIESPNETLMIAKYDKDVKLISKHSKDNCKVLCINNQVVHETNMNSYTFKRSF